MLIREFVESPNLKEVDLLDDLKFFMENDPQFYRRVMFPLILKIKKHVKSGGKCKDNIFRSCIDSAVHTYCQKFRIPGNEKSVFTDVDRDKLARQIFGQEIDRIHQGVYDRGEQ